MTYGASGASHQPKTKRDSCLFVHLTKRRFILIAGGWLFGGIIYDDTVDLENRNWVRAKEVFANLSIEPHPYVHFQKRFDTNLDTWGFLRENCFETYDAFDYLIAKNAKRYE